jgi:hypothetical protein
MRQISRAGLGIRMVAPALLAVSVMAAFFSAPVLAAGRSRAAPAGPPVFTIGGLDGVAATSDVNAWAVGWTSAEDVLILRWNGVGWTRMATPRLHDAFLSSVAASSAHNAWAVGAAGDKTLILHWNGIVWKRDASPSPPGDPQLTSVTATAGGQAWAVGYRRTRDGDVYLNLRWTGGRWRTQPDPIPLIDGTAGAGQLEGVAASSDRNAWAIGTGAAGIWTVIAHWNGAGWRQVPSPNIADGALAGVAAAGRDAWAVGRAGRSSLILRWTGSSWQRVRSPSPGRNTVLTSVCVLASGSAWAVGSYGSGKTLILHWNGRAWRRVASPDVSPGFSGDDSLAGVAAPRSGPAWAVGYTGGGDGFILNWNGSRWH